MKASSEKRLRFQPDQLLTAQENERKRLAAELHDELGHALLALKLHLSSIEKKMLPEQQDIKEEIRAQLDYINEVIQDVRRLYHDLSPGDIEDLGLTKALRTLINDFAIYVPKITWKRELVGLEGLFSVPVQTIIYRIIQEALTNIGKHADPTFVKHHCQEKKESGAFCRPRQRPRIQRGPGFRVSQLRPRGRAGGHGGAPEHGGGGIRYPEP